MEYENNTTGLPTESSSINGYEPTPISSQGASVSSIADLNPEIEQTPESGVCPLGGLPTTASPEDSKLAKTEIVFISDIDLDGKQPDEQLVSRLQNSISAPWGQLLTPVLVSRLAEADNGKKWMLRAGINRLTMATNLGWKKITVSIVEGSDNEKQLLVLETQTIRQKLNAYQQMENLSEWSSLLKATYKEYQPGGDKAKKAASKQANSLPSLAQLIETHSGLKPSTFYKKVQTFEKLHPEIKSLLEQNPKLRLASNERRITRLSEYTPEEQQEIVKFLPKFNQPEEAYFQSVREKMASEAEDLLEDELFPIDHEPFSENAHKIPDGSVDLILTDPNWFIAENSQEGEFWKMGSLEVAPQLTWNKWEEFLVLAATKLKAAGQMAVLLGQQNLFEVTDVIRKHFNIRWTMAYVHSSGAGTPARTAYVASHWRPLVLCRRKDAPPLTPKYSDYVPDVAPSVKLMIKPPEEPDDLITLLKRDRDQISQRIALIEAGKEEPMMNDVVMTENVKTYSLKKFHPWAQDVTAFREIIRRLTKPGDFVWDPFIGSGTTAIAAVTCTERRLENGKLEHVPAARRGRGCDVMKLWAGVAKRRLADARNPEATDCFEQLDKVDQATVDDDAVSIEQFEDNEPEQAA